MNEIEHSDIRNYLMDTMRTNFAGLTVWDRIEQGLTILCSDLPIITNDESRQNKLIEGLKKIKTFLIDKGIDEEYLLFLDEEISIHENTKQISLYNDEEVFVPKDVIATYAHIGKGQEGIVGIYHNYTYTQLKRLTNGVYKRTKLVKFYISREKVLYGKIVGEVYEYAQKIQIAHVVERKKKSVDPNDSFSKIFLFGESFDRKYYNILKSIDQEFYVYRFISNKNQELILLSIKKLQIGDYSITGVITHCEDRKLLTDTAKLSTKLPIMFVQNCRNRIIKYVNHDEFSKRIKFLNVNHNNLFEFPFTIKKNNKNYILKQPDWFKYFIWAWLTHAPIGLFNNYPLHIMMIGPQHSGKSLLLNALHSRSKESRSVFSGSSSTLKSLIPSFKNNPVKLGYLAESNRFAYCDEFLRCLSSVRDSRIGAGNKEESLGMMNDLLEHQKREAGSGISRVNVNMTSRIISTTNPVRGVNNVTDMTNLLDSSFISRFLVYHQTKDHVKMIRNSKDSDLKILDYDLNTNDWVSILDYLQSFVSQYDLEELDKIKKSVIPVLNEDLKKHYDSRHMHHLECLIDGIVKTRCLMNTTTTFKARKSDYELLTKIWRNIIKSWVNIDVINSVPIKDRIDYMPENCQELYLKITNFKRAISRDEAKGVGLKFLNKNEYIEAMAILLDNGLLHNDRGILTPYYMVENQT